MLIAVDGERIFKKESCLMDWEFIIALRLLSFYQAYLWADNKE